MYTNVFRKPGETPSLNERIILKCIRKYSSKEGRDCATWENTIKICRNVLAKPREIPMSK